MLDNLSIVIPYRYSNDIQRERIFRWTMARYSLIAPEAEVLIGSMSDPSFPYFCRSQAINNGVKGSNRKFILIADADAIAYREALVESINFLKSNTNYGWSLPYNLYYCLDKVSTEKLLISSPDVGRPVSFCSSGDPENSTSSLAILTRENFWDSGGFDERFIGWGPEDQAWADAVSTICGPYWRNPNHDLFHLWHPVATGTTRDNPYYQKSNDLWDQYKKANGNYDEMKLLVKFGNQHGF